MKFSLALKLNLVFVPVLALAAACVGVLADRVLERAAQDETVQTARVIMAAALATRQYTLEEVKPLLEAKYDFQIQTVSAYAATETIGRVTKRFPEYRYHEATTNPTNPHDRADGYETGIIDKFVRDPALKEWSEVRETSSGRNVVVAQPLRVASGDCLNCHSVPERAPKTMVEAYGPEHGFGWKLGQVIGAQVVTVPMSIPEQRAATVFRELMLTLVGVFAGLLIALNLLVHLVITSRVRRMSRVAELVSRGKSDSETFVARGTDELSMLERSFSRMRNSLASAMKMLEP
ncbi:MAG TPA: DUF3365 domain-containing protein [Burkholderiaceae bacterium]